MLILSRLYFIFVLLLIGMNTIFDNQTAPSQKQHKYTAHIHSIQMKENQQLDVFKLEMLVERFRNEELFHQP